MTHVKICFQKWYLFLILTLKISNIFDVLYLKERQKYISGAEEEVVEVIIKDLTRRKSIFIANYDNSTHFREPHFRMETSP